MTDEAPVHQATLNPNGVVAPLDRVVRDSVETIALALTALETSDLSKVPEMPGVFFRFSYSQTRDVVERKAAYTNWLLAKGLHDLTRGVREMLEEAVIYIEMAKTIGKTVTWGEVLRIRQEASRAKFPPLLARVNKGLSTPLHFTDEFLALQKVRNCLEHRAGLVGEDDVDASGKLRLVLPTLAFFLGKKMEEMSKSTPTTTLKKTRGWKYGE